MKIPCVAAILLIAGTLHANAADGPVARKYAVLSLIGDSLTVVTYRSTTGTHADRNEHETFPLADPVYDRAAAKAVERALNMAQGRSPVTILAASSPELYTDQGRLFDGRRVMLGDSLTASLRAAGTTHLVLITKHRADARVRTRNGSVGTGMLEGLGFYIDRQKRLVRVNTGETGTGLLGPYVYAKVSLVDLATSAVIAEEAITMSRAISTAGSETNDPWTVLTAEEKARSLSSLIAAELRRVVPLLVAER